MVNTRHINKNGLSFDCPDYYDIGKYPSSDEAHKSMVALSKRDRKCEIYVTVYRKNAFDNNAKRNMSLLERYLQLHNYKNITVNKKLPYCFNANVNHQMGNLKTTIAYNFDHNDVIMVVGNVIPSSNYECIEDIKIILDTIQQDNIISRVKNSITSKNKTIIGLIALVINFSAYFFIPIFFDYIFFTLIGLVPAIFLIMPENIKSSKILSIFSLLITMPLFVLFSYSLFSAIWMDLTTPGFGTDISFLIMQISTVMIWLFNVFCAILLYVYTGSERKDSSPKFCDQCGNPIKNNANYCNKCGEKIESTSDSSLKHELLYWYDEKQGYRLSITKLISLLIFIFGALLTLITNINDLSYDISQLTGIIIACIIVGLIFAISTFVIGWIFHYLLNRTKINR